MYCGDSLVACERASSADVDSSLTHETPKSTPTHYHAVNQRDCHPNSVVKTSRERNLNKAVSQYGVIGCGEMCLPV